MRIPVDDAPAVDLAEATRATGPLEVVCINRGPDEAYVEFDADADADTSNLVKMDEYVSRRLESGERISAVCAAGETAEFHVFTDSAD
jgi:hypothetical protein